MKMKLYLQRDCSSLDSRYQIYDEKGGLKYTVSGKRNPSGESMKLRTLSGETVCRIRGLGFSSLCVYSISTGRESMRLNIAVGSGRAAVRLSGISFFLRGDVLMGSYSILDADNSVVCVVGKDFAKGTVGLELNQPERELFCIATAACLDHLSVGTVPAFQAT